MEGGHSIFIGSLAVNLTIFGQLVNIVILWPQMNLDCP